MLPCLQIVSFCAVSLRKPRAESCPYLIYRRFKLKYAHFFPFHQWWRSRSKGSPCMAEAGMALDTVWRKTVHHPRLTAAWRRNSDSSSYGAGD